LQEAARLIRIQVVEGGKERPESVEVPLLAALIAYKSSISFSVSIAGQILLLRDQF
jgi:hypothetical protein